MQAHSQKIILALWNNLLHAKILGLLSSNTSEYASFKPAQNYYFFFSSSILSNSYVHYEFYASNLEGF